VPGPAKDDGRAPSVAPAKEPDQRLRVKKVALPNQVEVCPSDVVDRLYANFPADMARLAE